MGPDPFTVRLLVVDDDSLLRELLAHLLQETEFHLTAVSSGEGALQFFRKSGAVADVVLMDLQMPGESGAALAGTLRETVPSALYVGMSARTPSVEERAAFDAFVQKPFDAEALRSALQAVACRRDRPILKFDEENSAVGKRLHSVSSTLPASEPTVLSSPNMPAGTPQPQETDILDTVVHAKLQATIGPAPMRQLYEMTADDVELRLNRMRQSLAGGDRQALRAEAHAIKGGCSMVGAVELSRLAAKAEVSSETDSHDISEMFEACFRLRRMVTIVPP